MGVGEANCFVEALTEKELIKINGFCAGGRSMRNALLTIQGIANNVN